MEASIASHGLGVQGSLVAPGREQAGELLEGMDVRDGHGTPERRSEKIGQRKRASMERSEPSTPTMTGPVATGFVVR